MNIHNMTEILKYSLNEVTGISFGGFKYEIPENTFNTINYLCSKIGSLPIKSTSFYKAPRKQESKTSANFENGSNFRNKKHNGRNVEDGDSNTWNRRQQFQATKIEKIIGIDADINEMRLYLNKITDKTYHDMRDKLIEKINSLSDSEINAEEYKKIGVMLYDMCSSNKFYSKIFAELFMELAKKYEWTNDVFQEKMLNIMDNYKDIQYVDADDNYNGFCEMNKKNEIRRSITTFYLNLTVNGFINPAFVVKIVRELLTTITSSLDIEGNKNIIEELLEIVSILFNKDIIEKANNDPDVSPETYLISGKTILSSLTELSKMKTKDHVSFSNKSLFKVMDILEL